MLTEDTFRNKKLMIVAAHPDDELLGPGATMNRLINDYGANVHVVILGEGITSRSGKHDPDAWKKELETHRENMAEAQKKIGFHSLNLHDFPDNRFDSVDLLDIVKAVENEKAEFNPDIVFTHHGGDLNIDHRRTFEAVLTAFRPLQGENAETIVTFETPSATEWRPAPVSAAFVPNLFVGVSKQNLQAKIDGMECYRFEKRTYPHPRSPEALESRARYWGSVSGREFAEAFSIVRMRL